MTNKIPRIRREELIEKYSEYVVEAMDLGELMLYAQEQIAMGMIDLSDEELLEDISQSFDDEDEDSRKLYKFTQQENEIIDQIAEKYVDQQISEMIRNNGGHPLS
jgi:F0F1-type ATP synthase gamma subunit